MSMPNINPSDLDREALKGLIVDLEYILEYQVAASFKGVIAQIIEVLKALPRASGVPEAEAVAYIVHHEADGERFLAYSADVGWFKERGYTTEPLFAAPPPVAAPSGEATEERIAELQYEAGMYQSLYENVINTVGYQKANTIGELAGWQWRPNGATVWRSDATVKWLDEQGDAIEKRPVFTAYPYDNGGDTLYDALESALWSTPGWKDKVRATIALLTRTALQTSYPITSEPKDAVRGGEGQHLSEMEATTALWRAAEEAGAEIAPEDAWNMAYILHTNGFAITRTAPSGTKP